MSGSSPRGRGKQARVGATVDGYGLIPAWAGKTASLACAAVIGWAHPRVGGENRLDAIQKLVEAGSSPRGRGKLASSTVTVMGAGLIPAWAGKTLEWA